MKTKMLTALLSSLFLAILACPVLAAPIDTLSYTHLTLPTIILV